MTIPPSQMILTDLQLLTPELSTLQATMPKTKMTNLVSEVNTKQKKKELDIFLIFYDYKVFLQNEFY